MEYLALLAPILARSMGAAAAAGDRKRAEQLRQEAMKLLDIELPELDELIAEIQSNTELQKVMADPKYTEAGDQALGKMGEIAMGSGMTPEDLYTLNQAKLSAADYDAGVRGRNAQNRMARGISGSGIDLSNDLAGQQAGVDRSYQGALKSAADASARRNQMLGQFGAYADRLKTGDLNQKNLSARAQDAINEFNTRDKRYVRDYNSGLEQSRWNNQLKLGGMKMDALYGEAGQASADADRTEGTYADIGTGVSQGATAIAANGKKKREEDED
jgi:hypothetical protein